MVYEPQQTSENNVTVNIIEAFLQAYFTDSAEAQRILLEQQAVLFSDETFGLLDNQINELTEVVEKLKHVQHFLTETRHQLEAEQAQQQTLHTEEDQQQELHTAEDQEQNFYAAEHQQPQSTFVPESGYTPLADAQVENLLQMISSGQMTEIIQKIQNLSEQEQEQLVQAIGQAEYFNGHQQALFRTALQQMKQLSYDQVTQLTETIKTMPFDQFKAAAQTTFNASHTDAWMPSMDLNGFQQALSSESRQDIEEAITSYTRTLEGLVRDEGSLEWARIHYLRAGAYLMRTAGNRAENMEHAVADATAALSVFTLAEQPQQWAVLVMLRASAYMGMTDKEMLALALADYDAVLPILEREQMHNERSVAQTQRAVVALKMNAGESGIQAERDLYDAFSSISPGTIPLQDAYTSLSHGLVCMNRKEGDLKQNIDEAIEAFSAAYEKFKQANIPSQWGPALALRGMAYMVLSQEDQYRHKDGYLEYVKQAATDFDEALTVLTPGRIPELWAQAKMGRAYVYLVLYYATGEYSQVLERVIADSNDALSIFTSTNNPEFYAHTLQTRCAAYSFVHQISGNRSQNLQQAIDDATAALQIFSRERTPYEWAQTHMYRGNAYLNYYAGNRKGNIEQAIANYDAALTVFTRETFPTAWTLVVTNRQQAVQALSPADPRRSRGQVLADYDAIFSILSKEKNPFEWAAAHVNCGNAYLLSATNVENYTQNIQQAWQHYDQALQVLTKEKYPLYWSQALVNRGTARRQMMAPDIYNIALHGNSTELLLKHASNIPSLLENSRRPVEEAIEDFNNALTVLTKENTPREWAMAHRERGLAYAKTIFGMVTNTPTENVKRGLADFDCALQVITRESMPHDWAVLHINRGLIYRIHTIESPKEDALAALADYDAALIVFTPEVAPAFYRRIQYLRSVMFERLERWEDAHQALFQARTVQRDLVATAPGDGLRSELIADVAYTDMYLRDAQVLLRYQKPDLAEVAIALEEGRAQNMRVELGLDSVNPQKLTQPAARKRSEDFLAVRSLWRKRQHEMAETMTTTLDAGEKSAIQHKRIVALQDAYTAFVSAREAIRQHDDPDFMTPVPTLTGIASCISGPGEALVYLATGVYTGMGGGADPIQVFADGTEKGLALTVTREPDGTPHVQYIALPRLTSNALSTLIAVEDRDHMPIKLEQALQSLGQLGLNELTASLLRSGVRKATFVTYGRLSLFPLSAVLVQRPDSSRTACMGDLFEIAFAPSARAAEIAQQRTRNAAQNRERQSLLLVGNPLPSKLRKLPFAEAEIDTIGRSARRHGYASSYILPFSKQEATKEHVMHGLAQAKYAHLALHGIYNVAAPRQSKLILAGMEPTPEAACSITLAEILDGKIALPGLRLLVLSACETSLVDVRNVPDEVIGLAAGFLQAGAAGIIASLWPVDDIACFLLMTRFAQLYLDPQGIWSPVRALAEAQRWLRTEATNQVLATYDPLQSLPPELSQQESTTRHPYYAARAQIREDAALRALSAPDALPYAAPQYWAAFVVTGC